MNERFPNFHLLFKPAGAACNLRCQYCFYREKEQLYPQGPGRMSRELSELAIRQLLEAHHTREVILSWQGGEPTLMGLDYFKKAVHYAEQAKKPGQHISCTIQTNGTLLDDEWCAFFSEHRFLVGLSLDGPKEWHDRFRRNSQGTGTFTAVLRGWELLKKHRVEVNILCAVHAANENHGPEVYRFFRDTLGANFIQFIPIVEPGGNQEVSERSVHPREYGQFLSGIFDEWFERDNGRMFIQAFDVALGNWVGQYTLCVHAPSCGRAPILEHNGDLYACDHFVDAAHRLGNINREAMADLVASGRQARFGTEKQTLLPGQCQACQVLGLCHGGCPKDRFMKTAEGEPGLNYLCPGYQAFFTHIIQPLKKMAQYV